MIQTRDSLVFPKSFAEILDYYHTVFSRTDRAADRILMANAIEKLEPALSVLGMENSFRPSGTAHDYALNLARQKQISLKDVEVLFANLNSDGPSIKESLFREILEESIRVDSSKGLTSFARNWLEEKGYEIPKVSSMASKLPINCPESFEAISPNKLSY